MMHQMFLFASKSRGINPSVFSCVLVLPINEDGQPMSMDVQQAISKIPDHLRDGGYKLANAYSILQTLCETKAAQMFKLVLKD